MASAIGFFNPVDPLSINTLLTLSGSLMWIIQSNTPSKKADRSAGLKANGDENAWKAHNAGETRTLVYECHALTGFLKVPAVGTVTASTVWHIDSVKVDYKPTGWPTLTVQIHKHTGAANHTAASCNTYAAFTKLPALFGIPALINDTATTPVGVDFELKVAAIGLKSISYGLSCTHQDETGGTGDWLAGQNRDGVETLDVAFTGIPDDTDLTLALTWHNATDGQSATNTAVDGRSLSLVRHISRV